MSSTSWTASTGSPTEEIASRITLAIARFDSSAPAEPRSMTELPDRRQRRGGVRRHVRPVLIDDPDHTERNADAANLEPVREHPAFDDLTDRVGEVRHRPHRGSHLFDALLAQPQPVDDRGRHAGCLRGGDVDGICLEDLLSGRLQKGGGGDQRFVLSGARLDPQGARRGLRPGTNLLKGHDGHGTRYPQEYDVPRGDRTAKNARGEGRVTARAIGRA